MSSGLRALRTLLLRPPASPAPFRRFAESGQADLAASMPGLTANLYSLIDAYLGWITGRGEEEHELIRLMHYSLSLAPGLLDVAEAFGLAETGPWPVVRSGTYVPPPDAVGEPWGASSIRRPHVASLAFGVRVFR